MQVIKYDEVKDKIIEIRNQNVLLDSDVARLYDIETKRMECIEVEIFDFNQRGKN
ncbi:MAG: hypothetical protein K0R49_1260 [Burkholderiales bacterium]|jgi:hypothetical protein|nr:hypothetical protein [Burkholderiales bacterium]